MVGVCHQANVFKIDYLYIGRVGKMLAALFWLLSKPPNPIVRVNLAAHNLEFLSQSKPIKSINWPTARLSAERMRGNAARISHRE